jgi:hypothetical protein
MIFLVQKEYDAFLFVLENTHSFLKHLKEENLSYILFKEDSGAVRDMSSFLYPQKGASFESSGNLCLKVGTNENGSACGRWLSIGIYFAWWLYGAAVYFFLADDDLQQRE